MPNRPPARANVEAALRAQATRTAVDLIKERARAYAKRPMTLENVFSGLSAATPETKIAVAKHLIAAERNAPSLLVGKSQSSTPRRFCFPRVPSAGTKDAVPESGRTVFEPDLPGRKPKLRLTQRPRPEVPSKPTAMGHSGPRTDSPLPRHGRAFFSP